MKSLELFAQAKLDDLERRHLRRHLADSGRGEAARVRRDGRDLISFSCNDYLGLSQHEAVRRAAAEAAAAHGAGAGASRHVTGNHPLYRELEGRLARLKGTDDAVVFGSGYLANLGIIPTLARAGDLILADELSHACLLAGSRLSGAETILFRHNDLVHLSSLLAENRARANHCLIVTDGVFSMDGDLAPVAEMAELAARFDAWLMTDDAHGIGVLNDGRGSSFPGGVKVPVPLQMGTLSKAVGSYGGYLCAAQPVIDLIRTRARTLIYTTGLPPAALAASIKALDIIEKDPALCARPVEKARLFTNALDLAPAESPIVPVVMGEAARALDASRLLQEEGFLVTAIRPPTVPDGTSRLRFTFSAAHADTDILRLARALRARIL